MTILVIDIGGSNVKVMVSRTESRKFRSGKKLTPQLFIKKLVKLTSAWSYDYVSIGYPGVVKDGAPYAEPENLGTGWCD
jgi:polyphosphate glucokinase